MPWFLHGCFRPSTALTTATNYTITGVNGDYDILEKVKARSLCKSDRNLWINSVFIERTIPRWFFQPINQSCTTCFSGNQYTFTDPFGGVAQFEVGVNGAKHLLPEMSRLEHIT